MGVDTYWIVVAIIVILGLLLPQSGEKKKYYIYVITGVQIFICGFRYMYMTGDLRKYAASYYSLPECDWFGEFAWQNGRNAGFQWLMKAVAQLTDGDFQIFLFLLAVITQGALAILIYRYSPKPWLSYLVWNCMSFYITYDFSTIKQGLAMAILMVSIMFILEEKPVMFLMTTLLAAFVHVPALCFLPAYFLMKRHINSHVITLYIVSAIAIYLNRNAIVLAATDFYYAGNDEAEFVARSDSVGGRFAVIFLILLAGYILKGFKEVEFEGIFSLIVVSAIFQMFSMYNNVFTRFADYYLQFAVLFIPMIFYPPQRTVKINEYAPRPMVQLDDKLRKVVVMVLVAVMVWFYWRTCLGTNVVNKVDDLLNYRFMWQVK